MAPFWMPSICTQPSITYRQHSSQMEAEGEARDISGQITTACTISGPGSNIHTGLVSPQYHVKMDRSFQIVGKDSDRESPAIKWIEECWFLNNTGKQDKSADSTKQMQSMSHPEDLTNFPIIDFDQIQEHHNSNLPPPEGEGLIPTNEDSIKPPLRRSPRQTREPEWFVAHDPLVFDEQELVAEVHVRDPDTMYYHKAMKEPNKKEFLKEMDSEDHA